MTINILSFGNRHQFKIIKYSFLAWGLFYCLFNLYCFFWRQYALGTDYTFIDSQIWFLKEWGGSVLVTIPWLMSYELTKQKCNKVYWKLLISFISLSAILILRIVAGTGEYSGLSSVGTMVMLFPKYFFTLLLINGGWFYLITYKREMNDDIPAIKPSFLKGSDVALNHNESLNHNELLSDSESLTVVSDEKRIIVEHRGMQRSIDLQSIISLKAARNYVEIDSTQGNYIKRTSLKQLLTEFDDTCFMQVHRSYVINLNNVSQVNNTENGGAIALMSNAQRIPVSKRYKSELKGVNLSELIKVG